MRLHCLLHFSHSYLEEAMDQILCPEAPVVRDEVEVPQDFPA
jgi:hypothetical protein